jgi:acyl carrier protein
MSDTLDKTRADMQDIFRNVFGEDDIILKDDMTAADIDGWDSMMHITIIVAIEKHFGIRFLTQEVSELKGDDQNIGKFLRLVEKKLSSKR